MLIAEKSEQSDEDKSRFIRKLTPNVEVVAAPAMSAAASTISLVSGCNCGGTIVLKIVLLGIDAPSPVVKLCRLRSINT